MWPLRSPLLARGGLLTRSTTALRTAWPSCSLPTSSVAAIVPASRRLSWTGARAAAPVATTRSEVAANEAPSGRIRVKALLDRGEGSLGDTVHVSGWVRTVRRQKTFSFIEVNDGSSLRGVQVIANENLADYAVVDALTTGAAVSVSGEVVKSPANEQAVELLASSIVLVGACPTDGYPLQKKRHSLEFLRSMAHLRPRTNTIGAVARVRSALSFATHQFFRNQGFLHVHSPLITASDCEGAGEMFRVTTLPPGGGSGDDSLLHQQAAKAVSEQAELVRSLKERSAPQEEVSSAVGELKARKEKLADIAGTSSAATAADDFFGKRTYLTVSGQMPAEAYACALGDVYTFGPTFRAEESSTTRHLAEFWMVEPEMAFADLQAGMDNAEAYVKHTVRYALQHCADDLELFSKFYDKKLMMKLEDVVEKRFARVTYADAVQLLQVEIAKDSSKWQFPEVLFGTDLATEHERWLAEVWFGQAVFVYNYPKVIKPFYMRDNDDGITVAAMDLLVPGIGELIGGSQREERLPTLLQKLADAGLSEEAYWWYIDLRRYGSVPHSGYGLGFERLISYVTGVPNIRDVIPFPRTPGSCDF